MSDWGDGFYRRTGLRLKYVDGKSFPLLDAALDIAMAGSDEVTVRIKHDTHETTCTYRLDRPGWFAYAPGSDAVTMVDAEDRNEIDLCTALAEDPLSFYTADLSLLVGDTITPPPTTDTPFDTKSIELIDFRAIGVDPLLEKPVIAKKSAAKKAMGKSLFEWLEGRLKGSGAHVIFNDDGSNEIADFVALYSGPDKVTRAELFHCKAAEKDPVPGDRVQDIYEVAGQAVRCIRYTGPERLRERLAWRMTSTKAGTSRLIQGTAADIKALLADDVKVTFKVHIVQPGVGKLPSKEQAHLLAAANAYIVGGHVAPLYVIGAQ